jgi:malate synthase
MEIFDKHMPAPNQVDRLRRDVEVSAADLIAVPDGTITEAGLRGNISIAVQYMAAWLGGLGCVPLYNLMEDAATAEISRAQIWQWIRHDRGKLDDGRAIDLDLYKAMKAEEMAKIREAVGDSAYAAGRYEEAGELLDKITADEEFVDFLTLAAYEVID